MARRPLWPVICTSLLVLSPNVFAVGALKIDLTLQERMAHDPGPSRIPVIVQTAAPVERAHRGTFEALGGEFRTTFGSIQGFAGTLPLDRLAALASETWVSRISSDGRVRKMLDTAARAVGANVAWNSRGLTGRGVTVAAIDSGISGHSDFYRVYASTEWGANDWLYAEDMVDDWEDNLAKWWDGLKDSRRPRLLGWWDSCPSRIIGGWDFVDAKPEFSCNDELGHGSSVAGIIAGNGLASGTNHWDPHASDHFTRNFTGIAPEANIVACRVLDDTGLGAVSDVIQAIEWCVKHQATYGIRVINLSLGHPVAESYTTDPLCQACEYAWRNGIVVVVSAGNWGHEGYTSILSPGNDPYVITVGAVNDGGTAGRSDDEICSYSSRGPTPIDHVVKPDIVAPGNRVTAARSRGSKLDEVHSITNIVPLDYYSTDSNGVSEYFVLSGTSTAAGVVSGACALMLQQDPTLTPDTVKARLMVTAEKPAIYGPLWQGAGYISIPDALDSFVVSLDPARSPTAVAASDGSYTIVPVPRLTDGTNLAWEVGGDNFAWEPIYPPSPVFEVYQPLLDERWSAYSGSPGWPRRATAAVDLSQVAVFGEDRAEYLGLHGPLQH